MTLRQLIVIAVVICGFASIDYAHEPTSVALTYEVGQPQFEGQKPVEMDTLIKRLNARIDQIGHAHALDEKRLEVDLYGNANAAELDRLKRLIVGAGFLEFRIVADRDQLKDREIIGLAKAAPAKQTSVLKGDKKVAEWVTYDQSQLGPPDKHTSMTIKKTGDHFEVLVLTDVWNVTGEYLASADKGIDFDGKPAILVSFNKQGSSRLQGLTKQNLPSPAIPDVYRQLGVILDKRLMAAPTIRTTIAEHAMISGGSMSEREVDLIVDVMRSGALPCSMRLLSEARIPQQK